MVSEKKPILPGGIGEIEFNAWKNHPVTRIYLKYLLDMRDDIKGAAILAWESGKLSLAVADEMRGAANYLKRVAEPEFDEVIRFYDEIDKMNQEKKDDERSDREPSAQG